MALRKTLIHRLLNLSKAPSPSPTLRPAAHRRPIFHSAAPPLPVGDALVERIRALTRDRFRLEVLSPPPRLPAPAISPEEWGEPSISVAEVRKLLRASQMEAVRARLRDIPRSSISYPELVQICRDAAGADRGEGLAGDLDESGAVVVLGDLVLLRPEQIAKTIKSLVTPPQSNLQSKKELEAMEEEKAKIDERAEMQVRRELWCGLGLLFLQTAGFMRLTFWELSWDVMEPICFYVTSVYFMAGYAFFLRTSRDPSFQGFFESRFVAKQKRLIKAHNFDVHKFNELRREAQRHALPTSCDCCRRDTTLLGVTH